MDGTNDEVEDRFYVTEVRSSGGVCLLAFTYAIVAILALRTSELGSAVLQPSGEKLGESASENARKALEGLLGGQKLGRRPNVGGQDRAADKQKALLYSLLGGHRRPQLTRQAVITGLVSLAS